MRALLSRLVALPEPSPCDSVRAHWERHLTSAAGTASTLDRAILGGAVADRAGYAFASGYEEALHALVPELGTATLASLCVTEEGGGHPKAIQASLRDGVLRGEKRWSTLAPVADVLLVTASVGEHEARKLLRVVRVERSRAGVAIESMPETPFIPEIPHARTVLADVAVSDADVLPGDGWEAYVKPFRTVEDLHVTAALVAHVFHTATRHGLASSVRARLWSTLVLLRALASERPNDPAVHVALAGALDALRALLDEASPALSALPAPLGERWTRDRAILSVAEGVRRKRTEAAWAALT